MPLRYTGENCEPETGYVSVGELYARTDNVLFGNHGFFYVMTPHEEPPTTLQFNSKRDSSFDSGGGVCHPEDGSAGSSGQVLAEELLFNPLPYDFPVYRPFRIDYIGP